MMRSHEYQERLDDAEDAALDHEVAEALEQLRDEYPDDTDEELMERLYEEAADRCGCSDPGCPCDGRKRGGAP
jgi:hypothetical protein